MKKIIVLILFTIISSTGFCQVNWIGFDELNIRFNEHKKPILLFIHTDWCKICKMQEGAVFENDSLSKFINEHFYALKLNAENKKSLSFLGREYPGATTNKYHALATYLANKDSELSFPTILMLDQQFQLLFQKNGFVSMEEFREIISDIFD